MKRVQVVNSVWNGSDFISRKKADWLVSEGRALFLSSDQLRLTDDSRNRAAATRASEAYEAARIRITAEHLRHLSVCNAKGVIS